MYYCQRKPKNRKNGVGLGTRLVVKVIVFELCQSHLFARTLNHKLDCVLKRGAGDIPSWRGTSGPRTTCPGGPLVLRPRVRGDSWSSHTGQTHIIICAVEHSMSEAATLHSTSCDDHQTHCLVIIQPTWVWAPDNWTSRSCPVALRVSPSAEHSVPTGSRSCWWTAEVVGSPLQVTVYRHHPAVHGYATSI